MDFMKPFFYSVCSSVGLATILMMIFEYQLLVGIELPMISDLISYYNQPFSYNMFCIITIILVSLTISYRYKYIAHLNTPIPMNFESLMAGITSIIGSLIVLGYTSEHNVLIHQFGSMLFFFGSSLYIHYQSTITCSLNDNNPQLFASFPNLPIIRMLMSEISTLTTTLASVSVIMMKNVNYDVFHYFYWTVALSELIALINLNLFLASLSYEFNPWNISSVLNKNKIMPFIYCLLTLIGLATTFFIIFEYQILVANDLPMISDLINYRVQPLLYSVLYMLTLLLILLTVLKRYQYFKEFNLQSTYNSQSLVAGIFSIIGAIVVLLYKDEYNILVHHTGVALFFVSNLLYIHYQCSLTQIINNDSRFNGCFSNILNLRTKMNNVHTSSVLITIISVIIMRNVKYDILHFFYLIAAMSELIGLITIHLFIASFSYEWSPWVETKVVNGKKFKINTRIN